MAFRGGADPEAGSGNPVCPRESGPNAVPTGEPTTSRPCRASALRGPRWSLWAVVIRANVSGRSTPRPSGERAQPLRHRHGPPARRRHRRAAVPGERPYTAVNEREGDLSMREPEATDLPRRTGAGRRDVPSQVAPRGEPAREPGVREENGLGIAVSGLRSAKAGPHFFDRARWLCRIPSQTQEIARIGWERSSERGRRWSRPAAQPAVHMTENSDRHHARLSISSRRPGSPRGCGGTCRIGRRCGSRPGRPR